MPQTLAISIHALREEGDELGLNATQYVVTISIHALREEGDINVCNHRWLYEISIHALREEGDRFLRHYARNGGNFYPRPPRGGRLVKSGYDLKVIEISIHALREEGDLMRPDSGFTM